MDIRDITVNERKIYVNVDSICFATYQNSIKNSEPDEDPIEIYRVYFNNTYLDLPKENLEELIGSLDNNSNQN